jgi:hypothetical protein
MKRLVSGLVFCFLFMMSASAQIMLLDEDKENPRRSLTQEDISVIIPTLGSTDDQTAYVPLGDGLLILMGMGVAYLVAKNKKD